MNQFWKRRLWIFFLSPVNHHMKYFCSSFPSRRPLFKDASGTLDKSARFSALYRQDSNKLSNDDMLKLLADFRKLVMLLWVLRVINCLSNLTDVLETKIWKICSYRLYFGKCWSVLKIRSHICECGMCVCIYTNRLCSLYSLVDDSKDLTSFIFLSSGQRRWPSCL